MSEIDKSLGLTPISNIDIIDRNVPAVQSKHVPTPTEEEDFDYARDNLKEVIDHGKEALAQLIDIADQSQHPRAYEVIATVINTIASANKDLLDLSKKRKELQKKEEGPTTVNNNLILTTADLQKLLAGKKDE